jgi:hypothetical protein
MLLLRRNPKDKENELKVLGLDVADKVGWAFGTTESGIEAGGSFKAKDIVVAHDEFLRLIELWKPTVVITASPVRYYNAIVSMSRKYGVLWYLCAKREIRIYMEKGSLVNDKRMKKKVLGNGNATKADIMKKYETDDEDYADACLFVEYLIKP